MVTSTVKFTTSTHNMFVDKITVGKMTKDKMTACIIIADSVTTDKMIAVDVSVH